MYRRVITQVIFFAFTFLMGAAANAQLIVTEILANSVEEPSYEWIEVQNTSGTPLTLSSFIFDDNDGTALTESNIVTSELNTATIPANGVAVLYNAGELGIDGARFRAAWGLDESTTLIGIQPAPGLNNGGDQIGLWANIEDYTKDLADDGNGVLEVNQFDNAFFSLDFSEAPFPSPNDASIYYSGTGDVADGATWVISSAGNQRAYESTPTFFQTSQINNTDDIGNPGKVPAGAAADGLLITEVMYNPSSDPDNSFEFIEIFNNTGSTIDFAETNYFLDDEGGDPIAAANVTTGSVPAGETAVLFNDALSVEEMKTAWGEDVNFIAVDQFSALNNNGDQIGLWSDRGDYENDKGLDVFVDAVASLQYEDNDNGWPNDNSAASIFLSDLSADPSDGANWTLSNLEDGISTNAAAIFQDMVPDHPGGDAGSPGLLPNLDLPSGDFDEDGTLSFGDIDALTNAVAAGNGDTKFDVNGDGSVDDGDRVFWVESLKGTHIGDSNFDGEFGSGDLVTVFQPGEYEDAIEDNSTWAEGDWNGDLDFGTADLVFAFQKGGFEAGPREAVSSVPEPSSMILLGLGVFTLIAPIRSRRRTA